ncbi:MAG TPA: SDR family oxidoreductase [Cyclobacteriaceae bacterium]|nr:SDR family oxidoreductase [Cyclobacteriaceae bacterium]
MRDNAQYALVTGGTSGIGYELAKLFAKNGYNLVIVARGITDLNNVSADLTKAYNVEVITISKDLFDPQNAFALYKDVQDLGVTINILINDAGQGQYGEFVDTDINRELDIINLNISSLVILTKLFLREMIDRGEGKILNLSSIASKTPGPYQSVYHGTKAFVQSFTEAIRSEVKDRGITVTALLPGATDTDFFNKADMLQSKQVAEGKLDDPVKVAQDGYDALMSNDDMVVSGLKNKLQVAMANITPDEQAADKMKKQQAPVGSGE